MTEGYEYQISPKPATEVPLPETEADYNEFKSSGHPKLVLAAEIAFVLVVAGLMAWRL